MVKISIIGDGGWGTALALVLNSKGLGTVLWSYSPEYAEYLVKNRENTKFLKGVNIPADIEITSDDTVVKNTDYAIFAVPCEYLRSIAERFSDADFGYIVSATKGIENGTLKRPSEILSGYFKTSKIGVLSGPSISHEVAMNFPTALVLAADGGWKTDIQKILTTDKFRVYTSDDIIGVELGGALKNIVAVAAGVSDGLGYGANTKAGLLTRGLAEITRLGIRMGARKETFSGLSGIGDLATTCMSSYSRNRWFGEQIGKGRNIKEILSGIEMVVEGRATCCSAYELSVKYSVEMPITREVYEILYRGKDPRQAVRDLMTRDLKDED